jgi:hypothetical protein
MRGILYLVTYTRPAAYAPRRCDREHGLVVPAISEGHTARLHSGSHTDDLAPHADTEDRFIPHLSLASRL